MSYKNTKREQVAFKKTNRLPHLDSHGDHYLDTLLERILFRKVQRVHPHWHYCGALVTFCAITKRFRWQIRHNGKDADMFTLWYEVALLSVAVWLLNFLRLFVCFFLGNVRHGWGLWYFWLGFLLNGWMSHQTVFAVVLFIGNIRSNSNSDIFYCLNYCLLVSLKLQMTESIWMV